MLRKLEIDVKEVCKALPKQDGFGGERKGIRAGFAYKPIHTKVKGEVKGLEQDKDAKSMMLVYRKSTREEGRRSDGSLSRLGL